MHLRPHRRSKDGKAHAYWSLVETVRTADGPRQKTLCYLGELNSSAQARWVKTIEVFNEQGEARQLKLFPSHVAPPEDDPQVARVLVHKVRLEKTRSFGSCFLGLELWKRLELDCFFEQNIDREAADVPWSRIAALLAIHRLCAPEWILAWPRRRTKYKDHVDEEARRRNKTKSKVRAKVEHPFRILKRVFGFTKVRYRGLKKNHEWLCAAFALVNLYQHRNRLAPLGA